MMKPLRTEPPMKVAINRRGAPLADIRARVDREVGVIPVRWETGTARGRNQSTLIEPPAKVRERADSPGR